MTNSPCACSRSQPSIFPVYSSKVAMASLRTKVVVVHGAAGELGRTAIAAISKARGTEVAGAVDVQEVGRDAGEVAGLEEPLEIPIINDLVMVLGSLSQNTTSGVMVDFNSDSTLVHDNVRQAYPSTEAEELAKSLSGLGRIYNRGDLSQENAKGAVVVGDGIRVHSLSTPSRTSSIEILLSSPGEVLSYKHEITDVRSLMPGLLLAIRRVVRLKNLVYDLEKIL
ncbi:hypothetical protein R1sor_022294 [Riccia sorocarpa]|uniref:Dihydrodipicolinate reductase C-terminal domain-containing protein n=1 Tax=Riccia sorocarpa TaxID=122646 RepID=A0ABD3GJH0_9MARC